MTGVSQPREDLSEVLMAAWAVEHMPGRARVTLAIVGGGLMAFVRDTSSGTKPVAPCEVAPIRRLAIDAARGLLHPFAWWSE